MEIQTLVTELFSDMQTTIIDIEIALNKARLMIEGILDDTEPETGADDTNNALIFAAQRESLNTQAQIAHDYLLEIQNLIKNVQKE